MSSDQRNCMLSHIFSFASHQLATISRIKVSIVAIRSIDLVLRTQVGYSITILNNVD